MGILDKWKNRRVLVTGASGFVGQHVIALGRRLGTNLYSFTSSDTLIQGTYTYKLDLRNRKRVFEYINALKPEGVIHLAAAGVTYGTATTVEAFQVNTIGTENLLAALSGLESPPPVVLAGTSLEYAIQPRPIREDDPLGPYSPYGVSKAAAALCAAGLYSDKMPLTLIRPFNLYGPGEKEPRLIPYVINSALRNEHIALTACEQLRDYTFVADGAECFWQALNTPPTNPSLRILNLGSGSPVSLHKLVTNVIGQLARHGVTARVSFGAKPYREGEAMTYVADISKLKETLQWSPTTSLDDGIHQTIEALL